MAVQQAPAPASELERRKQVKLRLRGDLVIAPHRYEGRTFYVVKDPVSLRYYRFKEQEHFLLELMDGKHTLDDAQKSFEVRFRPDRLTLEDLEQFSQQLFKAGLVQNESPQAGKALFEQRQKRQRSQLLQTFTNILYIKIPVFDPDKLLEKMVPWFRFIFTTWFMLLSLTVMGWAVLLVLTHFDTFRERLPSFHEFFSFKTVVYLWFAMGVVKVIHEFGHGLSCKTFGGEVHEMGFLILCLSPAMYCNVSDAWTLPSKWKRIIISGAGIYVELMIAALATFLWWNTPGQPFVNYMSLCLMVVCSVNTVMFNGNPLMKFDGYYVLADLIEIPNLREKANRYLQHVFSEHCLGMEVQPEPYMALGRRILFVTYAAISWVYRWVVTFTILYFLSNFLKPYKLEVLSQMLALFALGSLLGWPLVRMFQGLHKRGRVPDMKFVNTAITATVIAALLVGFFFLPLPVSRVRETGVVKIMPSEVAAVHLKGDGRLEEIYVQDGQIVKQGAVLAKFAPTQDQQKKLAKFKTDYETLLGEVARLRQLVSDSQGDTRTEYQSQLEDSKSQLKTALTNMEVERKQMDSSRLLFAPRGGVVMGLPKKSRLGEEWKKEKSEVFCHIGDQNKLEVLLPVSPDDHDLLRHSMASAKKNNWKLPVVIRVQGRDATTWEGEIVALPQAVAKEIPMELSNKGGGNLAVKPGAPPSPNQQSPDQILEQKESGTINPRPDMVVPQNQVYLVEVNILNADTAIAPGAMAQVKVYCEYRSAAWWAWRAINKTFDLGLM